VKRTDGADPTIRAEPPGFAVTTAYTERFAGRTDELRRDIEAPLDRRGERSFEMHSRDAHRHHRGDAARLAHERTERRGLPAV
jgi:hypothetical protein